MHNSEENIDECCSFNKKIQLGNSDNKLRDVFNFVLETLCKISDVTSASIFILNKTSFEFEQRMTLPPDKRAELFVVHDSLLEAGQIGEAVSNGRVTIIPFGAGKELKYYVVSPMMTDSGVVGFVIFEYTGDRENPFFETEEFDFWNSHIAFQIENVFLGEALTKSEKLVEQKMLASTFEHTQSKKELEVILNSVQVAIFVINPQENVIVATNPLAVHIVGGSEEEIIGQNPKIYFRDVNNKYCLDGKIFSNFESKIYNSRNAPIPILRSVANISFGKSKMRIESFIDITERKLSEMALKQAKEMLELKVQERTEDLQVLVQKMQSEVYERKKAEIEAKKTLIKEQELNALKMQFVTLVHREFRTPLTFIRTAAQLVGDYRNKLNEKQIEKYVGSIISAVDNMTELMQNIISMEHETVVEYEFSPVETVMDSFIDSVLAEPTLKKRKIERLVVECRMKRSIVSFDEVLVRKILINLIANALKYSPADRNVKLIVVEYEDSIEFTVEDYGIGIPVDERERIYERFYRGSNVGTTSGSGLGMSIVRKSVEQHHGKIQLTSEIGKGTTFLVSIPKVNFKSIEE